MTEPWRYTFLSAKGRQFVDSGYHGSPPRMWGLSPGHKASMRVRFYNFADRPHETGRYVESTTMEALNHQWKLKIYPGGEDGVSCYLVSVDVEEGFKKEVNVKFSFEISATKQSVPDIFLSTKESLKFTSETSPTWGFSLAKRSDVLSNYLGNKGTLIVDVHLVLYEDRRWYPKPRLNAFGQQMLDSSVGSDIVFSIGSNQEKFHAHKMILSVQAPGLFDFVKDMKQGDAVEIADISSATFKIFLHHVYTGIIPDAGDATIAKELIVLADRFSCTVLKLSVEFEIVWDPTLFDEYYETADWLLFADGHSCPYLKEACMKDPKMVMSSDGWYKVEESLKLVTEVLKYSVSKRVPKHSRDFDHMPVHMLLEKLDDSGLDLDGTREMLIQRLKGHHSGGNNKRRRRFRSSNLRRHGGGN